MTDPNEMRKFINLSETLDPRDDEYWAAIQKLADSYKENDLTGMTDVNTVADFVALHYPNLVHRLERDYRVDAEDIVYPDIAYYVEK